MRRFVEGVDRQQSTLFPECLEDWVGGQRNDKTALAHSPGVEPRSRYAGTGARFARFGEGFSDTYPANAAGGRELQNWLR